MFLMACCGPPHWNTFSLCREVYRQQAPGAQVRSRGTELVASQKTCYKRWHWVETGRLVRPKDKEGMDRSWGDWWGDSEWVQAGVWYQKGGVGERLTKMSHTRLLQAWNVRLRRLRFNRWYGAVKVFSHFFRNPRKSSCSEIPSEFDKQQMVQKSAMSPIPAGLLQLTGIGAYSDWPRHEELNWLQ